MNIGRSESRFTSVFFFFLSIIGVAFVAKRCGPMLLQEKAGAHGGKQRSIYQERYVEHFNYTIFCDF